MNQSKTTYLLSLLCYSFFLFQLQNKAQAQCQSDDWNALKALYESTNGDFWTNRTGWGTVLGNSPPANCNLSTLYGVFTNNGRVTCIDMDGVSDCDWSNTDGNNLIGPIPPEIGLLQNLNYLRLTHNELDGSIPPEMGNLSNLIHLFLNYNNLTGSIPTEIGNLSELEILDVRQNGLDGEIPISFNNLTQLKVLTFSSNFFEGNVLEIIVNLHNLEAFNASTNQFTGNIPSSINSLTQLRDMSLYDNNFSGTLPLELGDLDQLTLVTLGKNQFGGCYPNNISNFCSFENWSNNAYMSDDTNFAEPWEDFCATGAGSCPPPGGSSSNVWPGDKNNDGIVDQKDVSLAGFLYQTGPARTQQHQNIEWSGHPGEDWGETIPLGCADIKHLDCNGNGVIETTDIDAVLDNLDSLHNEICTAIDQPIWQNTDYQIYLQPVGNINNNNTQLEFNVVLESKNGNNLTLQGGYFTINYNNVNTNITNAAMNFTNSWLGSPNINLIGSYSNFPNFQQIEIGFSKTNGTNSSGKGVIGQLTFVLANNAARSGNNLLDFEVIEIGVHDSQGNIQPIEEQLLKVGLNESNCEPNWTITEDSPFYNVYKSNGTIETDGFVLVGNDQQVEYRANRVTLNTGFSIRLDESAAGNNLHFRAGYWSCN